MRHNQPVSFLLAIYGGGNQLGQIAPRIEACSRNEFVEVRVSVLGLAQQELAELRCRRTIDMNSGNHLCIGGNQAQKARIRREGGTGRQYHKKTAFEYCHKDPLLVVTPNGTEKFPT